jgi:uncharacterized membrane protein (UPF0127 family)/CheY-like chemotaxis protein
VTKTKLIVNLTRGNAVCVGEIADRALPRMRGLMGRRALLAGEGLLLRPAPAIHTAFMRFPIDALFLDRELRVVEVVERLRPWRTASCRGARAVLELSAGESSRCGVLVGDCLELRERHERRGPVDAPPTAPGIGTQWPAAGKPSAGQDEQVHVARLRPLSVLIVSPDHRFATVMSLLLARRNCSVTTTANAARAKELIAREQVSVAILDAEDARLAATVSVVEGLLPPVGVVLVAESGREQEAGTATFAKFGPFDELMQAIERADEFRAERMLQP